jgi:hypothetical protein
MHMPPDILTDLLRGAHLNMDERETLGLLPAEKLRYSEVLEHLAHVIQHESWFPRRMSEHVQGDKVYEGTVIENLGSGKFACHSRRASVYDITTVAEESTQEFCSAQEAAAFYLKWELHLPGLLDSWTVA